MFPTVSIGPSTVAGGAVTLAAYVGAIVAFITGAHDAATISLLATGTITLVTTLLGRFQQATAAVHAQGYLGMPEPEPDGPELADELDGLPEYETHTGPVPPDQGDPGPKAVR